MFSMAKIQGLVFKYHEAESPEDLAKNVDSCVLSPEILTLFGKRYLLLSQAFDGGGSLDYTLRSTCKEIWARMKGKL